MQFNSKARSRRLQIVAAVAAALILGCITIAGTPEPYAFPWHNRVLSIFFNKAQYRRMLPLECFTDFREASFWIKFQICRTMQINYQSLRWCQLESTSTISGNDYGSEKYSVSMHAFLWGKVYSRALSASGPAGAAEAINAFVAKNMRCTQESNITNFHSRIEDLWAKAPVSRSQQHLATIVALRSVGIIARTANSGGVEYYAHGRWMLLIDYAAIQINISAGHHRNMNSINL